MVPSEELVHKFSEIFPKSDVEFYLNPHKKELRNLWVMRVRKRLGEKHSKIAKKNSTFESIEALADFGATGWVFKTLDKETLHKVLKYGFTVAPKLGGEEGLHT